MGENLASSWYKKVVPGVMCTPTTRCTHAQRSGACDSCDTIDGRYMGAVSDYASTCDGPCAELTHHDLLAMDPETQLGYCQTCIPSLSPEIRARLEQKFENQFL